jgi:hypothetical protein
VVVQVLGQYQQDKVGMGDMIGTVSMGEDLDP